MPTRLRPTLNAAVLELGAERFGWADKRARPKKDGDLRRGVGVAAYFDVSGGQPFERFDRNLEMHLNEDGSVTAVFNHPGRWYEPARHLRSARC